MAGDEFDLLVAEAEASQLVTNGGVPPFIPPRWESKPHSAYGDPWPSRGELDIKVARLLGWELFEWQKRAAILAGEYDPATGKPRFRTVGMSVARQNGKTSKILTRIARQMLPARQHVAYTAQDRSLARMKWLEHVEMLMETPFASLVAKVETQRNSERMTMKNGSFYIPVTPTAKKAARSLSMDLAIVDEAYAHTSTGLLGALRSTLLTRPMAQVYITSNAGEEDSILWRHYTDLGRAQVDDPTSKLCWIEYAPAQDASRFDPLAIRAANPSAGEPGGVDWEALLGEVNEPGFRKENMNLWPDGVGGMSLSRWWDAGPRTVTIKQVIEAGGRMAFGIDYDVDRQGGALVACGFVPDGVEDIQRVSPVDVIATVDDPADLDGLMRRAVANAIEHNAWILVGSTSPAASAIPDMERLTKRRVKGKDENLVVPISTTIMGRAVGAFHDAIVSSKIAHKGDPGLAGAVASVVKREVGDTFVWDRRSPTEGKPWIVTAATLAHWGAMMEPPPQAAKQAVGRVARRRR